MAVSASDCTFYGLDPRFATEETLAVARQQDYEAIKARGALRATACLAARRASMSSFLDMQVVIRQVQQRAREEAALIHHTRLCLVLNLDPMKVSQEKAIEVRGKRVTSRSKLADLVFKRRAGLAY